ncbi:MAG: SpvB/TcaC N-terminal domain-containing protein [Saprospiraceae bacterium]
MEDQREEKKASSPLLKTDGGQTKSNAIEVPSISLPKGGGALKGIDEKFQVNPANGTSSFSIPLPLTPGRNGFTPALGISYNSGAGNSVLGIGWGLDFPSIQRKTDKRLPQYFDFSDEEDTFMFSGVEDLVPVLKVAKGQWTLNDAPDADYPVRRYRPRIEGGFSIIERIAHPEHGLYWRVVTRDNTTTIFGRSPSCRIADPEDSNRIFQWLPEMSFDDKGSVVVFEYQAEDLALVPDEVQEKNRRNPDDTPRFANRYLKRVQYGNTTPFYPFDTAGVSPFDPIIPKLDWHFELVFDYGDHNIENPAPAPQQPWPVRPDPFSTYRAGFEIRTYRLLKRVLMFHQFADTQVENNATWPGLNGGMPTLVHSLDFQHAVSDSTRDERETELEFLESVTQTGYIWQAAENRYSRKSLPPMNFEYQPLTWSREIKTVQAKDLVHAPTGLSGNYQFTDLYNEGIAGILSEQGNGWHYKHNLGDTDEVGMVAFAPAKLVAPKPSFTGLANGVLQLQDLEANGEKQLVIQTEGLQGYFDLNDDNEWQPFRAFLQTANINLRDPNVRLLDLDGDGRPDLVLTEETAFRWWPNRGKTGFGKSIRTGKASDEEQGPAIVFSDPEQRIFLADMSGDGLTDIVRIRNGQVCYWPNLGYGRFGRKVTMANAPLFDAQDQFNPSYLQLADISGTGAADLIYLGQNKFRAWLNLSGNRWGSLEEIKPFFPTEKPNHITVTDLLGQGTGCLVWSSELPGHATAPMRYIDLMGGHKPHIMKRHWNKMGKETTVEYKSSTWFYLQDKLAGKPWITKLPFPVQCVHRVIVNDTVTGVRFVNCYSYHHGYYDHAEREFRGFGRVDQYDTEDYENWLSLEAANTVHAAEHEPPVLTRTWFHTGAMLRNDKILRQFEQEYWYNAWNAAHPDAPAKKEHQLPEALLDGGILGDKALSMEEYREALRACKGMTLRQEVFALDGSDQEKLPYTVATHNCHIRLVQPRENNAYASFLVLESEAMSWNYERNPDDVRVGHTFNIKVDEIGNVEKAVSVVYPRRSGQESQLPEYDYDYLKELPENDQERMRLSRMRDKHQEILNREQGRLHLVMTESDFTKDVLPLPDNPFPYRLRLPCAVRTYELKGIKLTKDTYFSLQSLRDQVSLAVETPYENRQEPAGAAINKRLIEHIRTQYRSNDLLSALDFGRLESLALPWEAYQLAFTPALLDQLYGDKLPAQNREQVLEKEGKYERRDGENWWISSGKPLFPANARERFYLPDGYEDPFETQTLVRYDPHLLSIRTATDALGNETVVENFDYRTLSPTKLKDINGNFSEAVTDALGMAVATAVYSKPDAAGKVSGDTLEGGDWVFAPDRISRFFKEPHGEAANLLHHASACFVYDFEHIPARVAAITREKHFSETTPNDTIKFQIGIEYSDGLGNIALKKVQAEPGLAPCRDDTSGQLQKDENGKLLQCQVEHRWIGNGRTVLNNKGKPVRQYEPYFSGTSAYETEAELRETGVSPHIFYDAVGRPVRTELPNGTFTKVEFTAWEQRDYDPNDTVLESAWFAARKNLQPKGHPERQAAWNAAVHANTPSVTYFDSLGRPLYSVAHNRWNKLVGNDDSVTVEEYSPTRVELDIEGNVHTVWDARDNAVMHYQYDMLGHLVYQDSMDGGERHLLNDCMGKPLYAWDFNERRDDNGVIDERRLYRTEYDLLHRPVAQWYSANGAAAQQIERMEYGESLPLDTAQSNNLRGQMLRHYDASGLVENVRFDFKGNPLEIRRQFAADYKAEIVDWAPGSPTNHLEKESFEQKTEYDALNRMTRLYNWHRGPGTRVSVYEPVYNARGVLESEDLVTAATKTADGYTGGQRTGGAINSIIHDAKGQRQQVKYANGTTTRYHYDPLTFRLLQLRTTRVSPFGGGQGGGLPSAPSNLTDDNTLQNLYYTYDPVGNISEILDDAYEPVFFQNQKVEPRSQYEYDALYRLTSASGRENAGNNTAPKGFGKEDDAPPIDFRNNTQALRNYTQRYTYDPVGNIREMRHQANGGSWMRHYTCDTQSNRLLKTWLGDDTINAVQYRYDTHGSMLNFSNIPEAKSTRWDYRDMIHTLDLGGGGEAYYQYDSGKQRSRKVIERNGNTREERWYLGGLEWYRKWQNDVLVEEIETCHLFDGGQRVLMAENVLSTNNNQLNPGILYRYQYSNHLGSVGLELNGAGAIISYEEYHPYGTAAYRATGAGIRAAAKRYRYTGMERDEESGLSYHTARYYLPWLGRWGSCDPIGMGDGVNLYRFSSNNPLKFSDNNGNQVKKEVTGTSDYILVDAGKELLWQVAKKFNTTPDELVRQNPTKIKWDNGIPVYKPGDIIQIPYKTEITVNERQNSNEPTEVPPGPSMPDAFKSEAKENEGFVDWFMRTVVNARPIQPGVGDRLGSGGLLLIGGIGLTTTRVGLLLTSRLAALAPEARLAAAASTPFLVQSSDDAEHLVKVAEIGLFGFGPSSGGIAASREGALWDFQLTLPSRSGRQLSAETAEFNKKWPFTAATDAVNEELARLSALSNNQRNKVSVVTAATDITTGEVRLGIKISEKGPSTYCAEDVATGASNPDDLFFAEPVRPNGNKSVPVCERCDPKYRNFPYGTPKKGGSQ